MAENLSKTEMFLAKLPQIATIFKLYSHYAYNQRWNINILRVSLCKLRNTHRERDLLLTILPEFDPQQAQKVSIFSYLPEK
jgi:hypothetical protein